MKINPIQIRKVLVYPERIQYGILPSSNDNYITRDKTNYKKAHVVIYLNENIMERQQQWVYFESDQDMENWLDKYVPNFIDL